MGWLDNYRAAKTGTPPPQQYGQPPSPYGYGQPQPQQFAPPPHAPFGYDQYTGVRVAPYGYDQQGNVITQPPQAYPPPPPSGFDQRGLPLPQGYGQPPYGYPQGQQPPYGYPPQDSGPMVRPDGKVHYMDAAAHFKGRDGVKDAMDCPRCRTADGRPGVMFSRKEGSVTNLSTGQLSPPAPECSNCGYNGKWEQSGSGSGMDGMATQVDGRPHMSRGGASLDQAAHLHGMKNLFAPREPQRARGHR